jgi:hypothetical protein
MNVQTRTPFAALLVFVLAACGGKNEGEWDANGAAGESIAAVEAGADLKYIAEAFAAGLSGATGETAVQYLAAAVPAVKQSLEESFAGCVTVTTGEGSVTAVFACTGPAGVLSVTGTVAGTVRPTLAGVPPRVTGAVVELSTSNLAVSGRSVTGDMTIAYTISPEAATMELDVEAAVDSARAGTVHVTGTLALSLTETCVAADGSLAATAGTNALTVAVAGYERCGGACPSQGGSIAVSGGRKSITISFDGTNRAQVTVSGGSSFTLPIVCSS